MTTQTVSKIFELELEVADGTTYSCDVEAHSKCYYHPGRLSGPPEDCYPAESDQETTLEILDCFLNGEQVQLDAALLYLLEAALPLEWIDSQLWKQFMSGDAEEY